MSSEIKLVVRNIGMILSGKLERPLLDGDCIVVVGETIAAVGYEKDLDTDNATVVVDAKGTTVSPGLIDSHVHPVIGDYTPRQQQMNWIDSCLHGGVTCMISAGEVHAPGRPKDIVDLKAMAIASPALVRKLQALRSQDAGGRACHRRRHAGAGLQGSC